MYCPSCGTLNDDNNFRCVQCGSVVQSGFAGGAPQTPGYGPQMGYHETYSEGSQATTALILAAISWAFCGIFMSLPAFFIARGEIKGINAGLRDPSKLGTAKAAWWLSLINVILNIVVIGIYIAIFATMGTRAFEDDRYYEDDYDDWDVVKEAPEEPGQSD